MTAGKNQAQPIILNAVLFIGPFRRTQLRFEIAHELVLRRIKSCPSTKSINGFESGRRNQPWSRVAGYSTPRPQAQRSRKGFVHRLLGKIKITEQADQSCQDPTRIFAIKEVEPFTYLLRGTPGHDDDFSKLAVPDQIRKTADRCTSAQVATLESKATQPLPRRTRIADALLSFVRTGRFRVAAESRATRTELSRRRGIRLVPSARPTGQNPSMVTSSAICTTAKLLSGIRIIRNRCNGLWTLVNLLNQTT
jgi:hypothetical protein